MASWFIVRGHLIGGFDLAARWVGWETAWFSEIHPYACKVLAKNFPGVPNHGDITQIDFTRVEPVEVLCGGFPCQDISIANPNGAGLDGARSGLWSHYTPEPLANFDPVTLSWKTSQHSLFGGLSEFLEAWPRSGTMRSGSVFPRVPLVPRTSEIDCGFLPTINQTDYKGCSRNRFRGSPHFRGVRMSEGLRTSPTDPIYTHPRFAEAAMGFPPGWTELSVSATPSSPKSRKSSSKPSKRGRDE